MRRGRARAQGATSALLCLINLCRSIFYCWGVGWWWSGWEGEGEWDGGGEGGVGGVDLDGDEATRLHVSLAAARSLGQRAQFS